MSRFRIIRGALAALLLIGPAEAKNTPDPHLYGPEPSWAEYRRIAEAAIRERLVDPESARFTWRSGIAKAELRPELFQPKVAGYWACGRVNAKNRLGGYSGGGTFMVAVDYGRALATSLDTSPTGVSGSTDTGCSSLIARGILPPVPAETDSGSSPTAASSPPSLAPAALTTTTGLTLHPMPEGAYVSAVAAGSPAAKAGLKPGMVIASVNAVPLANMGETMVKVIDAAGSSAILGLIGGTTIKLGAAK